MTCLVKDVNSGFIETSLSWIYEGQQLKDSSWVGFLLICALKPLYVWQEIWALIHI